MARQLCCRGMCKKLLRSDSNGITAKGCYHRIWIVGKKSLVKRAPDLVFMGTLAGYCLFFVISHHVNTVRAPNLTDWDDWQSKIHHISTTCTLECGMAGCKSLHAVIPVHAKRMQSICTNSWFCLSVITHVLRKSHWMKLLFNWMKLLNILTKLYLKWNSYYFQYDDIYVHDLTGIEW